MLAQRFDASASFRGRSSKSPSLEPSNGGAQAQPGPSDYRPDASFKVSSASTNAPAFSMAGKAPVVLVESPGPSDYRPEASKPSSLLKSPAFSMPTAERMTGDAAAPLPGPLDYRPEQSFRSTTRAPHVPAASMGTAQRMGSNIELQPGPLDYQTERSFKQSSSFVGSPAYSIGSAVRAVVSVEDVDAEASPGPADYAMERSFRKASNYHNAPAFSMPSAARKLADLEAASGPGPLDYRPEAALEHSSSMHSGPAYSMPAATREERIELQPGPSDYQPERSFRATSLSTNAPTFKMPTASRGLLEPTPPAAILPGPSEYKPDRSFRQTSSFHNSPAFSMTTGQRGEQEQEPTPSPLQYRPEASFRHSSSSTQAPAFSMTTGARVTPFGGAHSPAGPGPGLYSTVATTTKLREAAPAFSMGTKRETHAATAGPGPAQYFAASYQRSARAPAFSFGGGASRSPSPTRNSGDGGRLSPTRAPKKKDAGLPALGRSSSLPAVSLNALPSLEFNILDPLNNTRRRAPRFSFGRRTSNPEIGRHSPGPAAYLPTNQRKGGPLLLGRITEAESGVASSAPSPALGAPGPSRRKHTVGSLHLPQLPGVGH